MTAGVYVIIAAEVGCLKVGCSADVERRLEQIQTCCPVACEVYDILEGVSFEEEATLHSMLSQHHVRGEWFTIAALTTIDRRFKVVRSAAAGIAGFIANNSSPDDWDGLKADLYAAGAKNIADALSNIVGSSLISREVA